MDHVAIDLGGRESQICIRQDNNEVRLEKRLATIKLKGFFKTLPPSRVIVETCAEAFAVAEMPRKQATTCGLYRPRWSAPSVSGNAASRPMSATRAV